MKKIFFKYYTGYCGEDGYDVQEFPNDVTDKELDEYAWQGAIQNGESYGHNYVDDTYEPEVWEEENDFEYLSNSNVEGSWCVYDPKLHDRYL